MTMNTGMIVPVDAAGIGLIRNGLDAGLPQGAPDGSPGPFEELFTGRLHKMQAPGDLDHLATLIPAPWQPGNLMEVLHRLPQPRAPEVPSGQPRGVAEVAPEAVFAAPEKALLAAQPLIAPKTPAQTDMLKQVAQTPDAAPRVVPAGTLARNTVKQNLVVVFGQGQEADKKSARPSLPLGGADLVQQTGKPGTQPAEQGKPLTEARFERLLQAGRNQGPETAPPAPAQQAPEKGPAPRVMAHRQPDMPQPRGPSDQPDTRTGQDSGLIAAPTAPRVESTSPIQAAGPADAAAMKQPHPVPVRDHVVVEQITSHFDRQGVFESGQAHLKLYPEELGEVHLHIDLDKGHLAARLHAETPEVRDILQRNLDHLRQALEHQGLKVNRLEVAVTSDSSRADNQAFHSGTGSQQGFNWTQNESLFQHQGRQQHHTEPGLFDSRLEHTGSQAPADEQPAPRISGRPAATSGVSLRI